MLHPKELSLSFGLTAPVFVRSYKIYYVKLSIVLKIFRLRPIPPQVPARRFRYAPWCSSIDLFEPSARGRRRVRRESGAGLTPTVVSGSF